MSGIDLVCGVDHTRKLYFVLAPYDMQFFAFFAMCHSCIKLSLISSEV